MTRLSVQLGRLSIAAFLPLIVFSGYDLHRQRQVSLQEQAQHSSLVYEAALLRVSEILRLTQGMLEMVAEHPAAMADDRDDCTALLDRVHARHQHLAFIGLVDANGLLRCGSLPFDPGIRANDRAWFRRVMAQQKFAIGEYAVGRSSGLPSLHLAVPVFRDGEVTGAVNAALDVGWLAKHLLNLPRSVHSETVVFDAGGTALARVPPRPPGSVPFDIAHLIALPKDAQSGVMTGEHDGVRQRFLWGRVPPEAPQGALYVVVTDNLDAVTKDADGRFLRRVAWIAAIASAVLGFLLLGLRIYVFRPVALMRDRIAALREGPHSRPPGGNVGPRNELTELADHLLQAVDAARERELLTLELATKDRRLREIRHRIKNHLAVLAGMVSMEARSAETPPVARTMAAMRQRIMALSDLYTLLNERDGDYGVDVGHYLQRLVESSSRFLGHRRVRFETDIRATARKTVEEAASLGILVNEIVTNSLKHAAFPEEGGVISVSLEEAGHGGLRLCVGDNGRPPAAPAPRGASLGTTIINSLARQLSATVAVNDDDGCMYEILLPASEPEVGRKRSGGNSAAP